MQTALCAACGAHLTPTSTVVDARRWEECTSCGSAALTPRASVLDNRLYADADYCSYLSMEESVGEANYFEHLLLAHGVRRTESVLDFGAGSCRYQRALEAQGWSSVWSYEVNDALVRRARQELRVPQRAVSVHDALPRATFAAIICNMVLEHVDEPAQLLRDEVVPLLAPDGLLLATMPHAGSLNRRILRSKWIGYSSREHNWFLSARGAGELLRRVGLAPIAVSTRSLLFTRFDHWRPKGFVKRLYKQTVMRCAEGMGQGDAILFVGRAAGMPSAERTGGGEHPSDDHTPRVN